MAVNQFVAPSLLAFDFHHPDQLNQQLDQMINLGIKTIHYDVIDGKYTNTPKQFDYEFLDMLYLKGFHVDVHFMVIHPYKYTKIYLRFPNDSITFHIEGITKLMAYILINKIHRHHRKVGIAIKLNTDINKYAKIIQKCDMVTIMGVEPGKGGQPIDLAKVKQQLDVINQIKNQFNPTLKILLDGGVNDQVVKAVGQSVDCFISGTYFMKSKDQKSFIQLVNSL